MINNKILGLMGLSARAGKVCFGTDSTIENLEKGKVKLVIVAKDSSERTKKNFLRLCEKYNVHIIEFGTIDDISKSIGKQNKAVIGIKDINLGAEIEKILNGGDVIG